MPTSEHDPPQTGSKPSGRPATGQTSQALAQGSELLRVLSQKAAAARAEAECSELRMLLSEARNGDPQRLQHWLDQYAGTTTHLPTPHLPTPHHAISPVPRQPATELDSRNPELDSPRPEPAESRAAISSWNDLLPGARRRLAMRAEHLRSGVAISEADLWLTSEAKPRQDTVRTISPAPHSVMPNRAVATAGSAAADPTRPQHAPVPQKKKSEQAELVKKSSPEQRESLKEKDAKHLLFSRMGGVSASIIAHLLLLLLLALITVKMAPPPASLALTNSTPDVVTQTLEISEPLEIVAPESSLEPSQPSEAFDISESLAEGTTSISDALGDMAQAVSVGLPNSAMLAAGSGQSGPMNTNASFFGAAASGNCFCYVIDGSGSMRNGPWDAAKIELLKSLASLKQKQRFYIVFFNRELSAIPMPGEREPAPRALYATAENLEHARRWIDTLKIGIGAPPNAALELAIAKEPDAIYLLTDGVTKADVPQFLREKNRVSDLIFGEQVRVPIHPIAFYSLDGQQLLKQIATENSGQFIYVPDPRKRL